MGTYTYAKGYIEADKYSCKTYFNCRNVNKEMVRLSCPLKGSGFKQ